VHQPVAISEFLKDAWYGTVSHAIAFYLRGPCANRSFFLSSHSLSTGPNVQAMSLSEMCMIVEDISLRSKVRTCCWEMFVRFGGMRRCLMLVVLEGNAMFEGLDAHLRHGNVCP